MIASAGFRFCAYQDRPEAFHARRSRLLRHNGQLEMKGFFL